MRELRVSLQLEVRAWGMDSLGRPFSQTAKTLEISTCGARLEGIRGVKTDDVIGLQYRDQKSRFRVVWVGEAGTDRDGQIGVESIVPEKCIWMAALDKASAGPKLAAVEEKQAPARKDTSTSKSPERRRNRRYSCMGRLQLRTAEAESDMYFKLTDISMGGCYGETLSPLPVGTLVSVVCSVGDVEFTADGVVRTTHPSMGNGIAFTKTSADDWKKLANVIQQLGGEHPEDVAEGGPPEIAEPLEILIRLLEAKGIISHDEFVRELRKQLG